MNTVQPNSTHRVEVVPVALEPHPNADSLSIVRVHGYQAIVRTEDWRDRTVGAYCPPDSVVPPGLVPGIEGRIKAIRLRGQWSEGLLVPAPEGAAVGDDVAAQLGIGHYDPPVRFATGGGNAKGPSLEATSPPPGAHIPTYDLEAARRWSDATLALGERVIVTEKIHGANGRWTFRGGAMHAGSRAEWKRDTTDDGTPILWWLALLHAPEVSAWCEDNPDAVVYGEVYGRVQDLRYGVTGAPRIACFDIWRDGRFLDHDEARAVAPHLPWVPVLYDGPWLGIDHAGDLAEGLSVMPGAAHVREGCVIKPAAEQWHEKAGRVALKVIGRGYLSRKGGDR